MPSFSRTRLLALGAALVASAVLLVAPGAEGAPTASSGAAATARYAVNRPLCATPARADQFRCFAVASEPASADTPGAYRVAAIGHGRRGHYSPDDLAKAYSYNPNLAVNQTVAVVDWYDDPYALADLNAFDRAYHLPTETSRSFRKVNQDGRPSPLPQPSWDSATEIALDVQAVRAVCHKCRILLVEADAPTSTDLARAENTAARLHANEISNSFGGPESGIGATMIRAFNHPGIVITASTGDDGWFGWDYANSNYWTDGEAGFPASSTQVVAVGGTTLRVNANGTRKSETVWNNNGANDAAGRPGGESLGATGGGCSRRFPAGTWQWHTAGYGASRCGSTARNRLAADIAAVGDPRTGFDIRDSYGQGGWLTVGGTSLSAPVVAAMYALAGGAGGSAYPAASLYVNTALHPQRRYDVVSGGNGYCGGVPDLSTCMAAVDAIPSSATNNPNGLTGEPLDCSFRRDGAPVSTPPARSSQCNAVAGYDGPSGLGAPVGVGLFHPTAGYGSLTGPSLPRLGRTQTWRVALRSRVADAHFTLFRWTWGDGTRTTATTAARAAHAFKRPGTYTVRALAYDSRHQITVRQRTIRVGLAPVVHYGGPRHIARARRATFSAGGSHAVNTGAHVTSIGWHWGDGRSTGPSARWRATHRYSAAGTYRVRLTVRDSSGVSHTVKRTVKVG